MSYLMLIVLVLGAALAIRALHVTNRSTNRPRRTS